MLPNWNAYDGPSQFAHAFHSKDGGFVPVVPPHFIPFTGFGFPEPGVHFVAPPADRFADHSLVYDPHAGQRPLQPYIVDGAHNGYFYPPAHPPFHEHPPHLLHQHPPPIFMHDPRLGINFEVAGPPPVPVYYPPLPPQLPPQPPPLVAPIQPSPSFQQVKVPPLSTLPVSKPSPPQRKLIHRQSNSVSTGKTASNAYLHRRNNTWLPTQRSSFLEQFRNTRNDEEWTLKAIFGHIVEFSVDQHGSRFIQAQLESATDCDKAIVFSEIYPRDVDKLVRDVFGNYVLQKFLELGTDGQKSCLVKAIEQQVYALSTHIYGCRVVQKALDSVSEEHQGSIVSGLSPRILDCIKDAHGNHVVQKIVEVVPPTRLTFLPRLCDRIFELATHPYGCRVLQRALEHLPQSFAHPLVDATLKHTMQLMKDQYGNYVIQFILEHGHDNYKARVLAFIKGRLVSLSCHKYASNVCEKSLMFSDPNTRKQLIDELIGSNLPHGKNVVQSMAKDPYGNYVLQRALTLSEGTQRETFFSYVQPMLAELRKASNHYSRPLISLERMMDTHFERSDNQTVATVEQTSH